MTPTGIRASEWRRHPQTDRAVQAFVGSTNHNDGAVFLDLTEVGRDLPKRLRIALTPAQARFIASRLIVHADLREKYAAKEA